MKYLYTYILTCCVLPFFWHSPTPAPAYEPPADFGPDSSEYPYRCDCYAVEPDMECTLWAWANCEVHPTDEN